MHAFLPPLVIESNHIVLRPPLAEDSDALFHTFFSDPETMHVLPFPRHQRPEESLEVVRRYRHNWRTGSSYAWVMEQKSSGMLAGIIELQPYLPRVEIGLISSNHPESRRRIAGLHVLRELIEWLRLHPDVHRIHAFCAAEGRAASAMERLGFKLEARLKNWELRPNRYPDPGIGDSLLFAMTREPTEG